MHVECSKVCVQIGSVRRRGTVASESRLREPVFESWAAVSNLGVIRLLYIAPGHAAV